MGIYYKLVNHQTRERIEPSHLGGGGIKFAAMIAGPSSKLLMFLHLGGDSDWTVVGDTGAAYEEAEAYADATETYRVRYNEWWGGNDSIERSKYAPPEQRSTGGEP